MEHHLDLLKHLPRKSTSLAGSHGGNRPLFPAKPRPTIVETEHGTWEQGTEMLDKKHEPLTATHSALIRIGIDMGIKQGVLLQAEDGTLAKVRDKKLLIGAGILAKLLWGIPRPELKMNSFGSYTKNVLKLWTEINLGAIGFTPKGGQRFRIPICSCAIDEEGERVIIEFPDTFLQAFGRRDYVMLAPATQLLQIKNDNARCVIPWIHSILSSPTEEVPDIFTVEELLLACGYTEKEVADMPPSRRWRVLNGESKTNDFIACLNRAELTTGESLRACVEVDTTWDGQERRYIALWVDNPQNPFAKSIRQAEFIRQTWSNAKGSESAYTTFMESLDPETFLNESERTKLTLLKLTRDSDISNQRGVKAVYKRLGHDYNQMLRSVMESRGVKNPGAIITARLKELITIYASNADKIKTKLSQPVLKFEEDPDYIAIT